MDEKMSQGRRMLFERSRKRSLDCLCNSEYSRAYAHLIIAMNIEPEDDDTMNAFLFTMSLLSNELEVNENWNELLVCYQEALEVLPHSSQVLHGLATVLFRLGHIESATSYFLKAYRENPFFSPSLYCIDNIRNALVQRWHFIMLNDKTRNASFTQAIRKAVASGNDCVLDIGAGTGILSMIALDSGAKTVYSCEANATMFSILRNVIEENKKDVHLINKLSYDINIPGEVLEKVNLVVTETFDAGLFGEHVLEILSHAWKHLLSADEHQKARVIPKSALLWAVPLQSRKIHNDMFVYESVLDTLGLSDTVWAATNVEEPYTTEKLNNLLGGYTRLSNACTIMNVDFNNLEEIESLLNGKLICQSFLCNTAGQIDAVAVWFDLFLDDEVMISSSPDNLTTCCWEQAVFYASPKILKGSSLVQPGDTIDIQFLCKGHLTLESVSTQTNVISKTTYFVDPVVISALNSSHLGKLSSLTLSKISTIIDVSTIPIFGLRALRESCAEKLVILPSKYLVDIRTLQEQCKIPNERVRVMSYEEICIENVSFDVVITEPVDLCGLLKKNVFEDIALLRTKCSSQVPTIYPKQLSIFAMLIDSPSLCQQSKIISDENCMGYTISKFLNIYQCNISQDIQVPTLCHEKLCGPVKLCDIDLDQLTLKKNQLQSWTEFRGSVDVKIKRPGNLCAIPFWFDIVYDPEHIINTLSNASWKQAAVVLDDSFSVSEGDTVQLKWICRNSCLHVTAIKSL